MRRKPGGPLLAQALKIAKFEPGMYKMVETFLPPSADDSASGAIRQGSLGFGRQSEQPSSVDRASGLREAEHQP